MWLLLSSLARATTLGELAAALSELADRSLAAPAVQADWAALSRHHGLTDAPLNRAEYGRVRLAHEGFRDGGLAAYVGRSRTRSPAPTRSGRSGRRASTWCSASATDSRRSSPSSAGRWGSATWGCSGPPRTTRSRCGPPTAPPPLDTELPAAMVARTLEGARRWSTASAAELTRRRLTVSAGG